ncbi:hypothetical protein FRC12_002729 [Ceratobasidium sp. 428]|nr:hypothetical protein FRC12_002729 [Ceratobasidium sp. 428]
MGFCVIRNIHHTHQAVCNPPDPSTRLPSPHLSLCLFPLPTKCYLEILRYVTDSVALCHLSQGHWQCLQRRDSWAPPAPRFDPFAASVSNGGGAQTSVWSMAPLTNSLPHPSANLLAPRAQKIEQPALPDQDSASPEHISIMLRSLGITPSPGASPMPVPAPIIIDRSPQNLAADSEPNNSDHVHGLHPIGPYAHSRTHRPQTALYPYFDYF